MLENFREDERDGFGWTMVLDKGLGLNALDDLLVVAASYVQVIKFGWGTSGVLDPELVRTKTRRIRERGIHVCPGGTFLEIAYARDLVDEFLVDAQDLGFDSVEVSNGAVDMRHRAKLDLIGRAQSRGFVVFSEIGKKDPTKDRSMGIEERAEHAHRELEAGSEKVIMEARESGSLGIFDGSGSVRCDFLDSLVSLLDLQKILFEAPRKSQQVWLVKQFGAAVHLGNVAPGDAVALETLRRGLRADTLHDFLP
ncbi:MAG: phosphosulfolactate synthase [Gemmatimonadota bacterium]